MKRPEQNLRETEVNLISEGTRIEGKIAFDQVTRVHGSLIGEVLGNEGSTLILGQSGLIEGNVHADILWVEGYIQGDITAKTRVVICSTGRVVGNIQAPSVQIDFGAYFEGTSRMGIHPESRTTTLDPGLSTA